MSLKINKVVNGTEPEQEYVELIAIGDTLLNGEAIIDRTFDDNGKETDIYRHFYMFPSQFIKKDNLVRLYTGKGQNNATLEGDIAVHNFHMNSDHLIWNNNGKDMAILIRVAVLDKRVVGK